jgi:NADH dehydrogenase FAD-containing subunit
MGDTVDEPTADSSGQIVIAGAGYAGLHVALRLTAKLRSDAKI